MHPLDCALTDPLPAKNEFPENAVPAAATEGWPEKQPLPAACLAPGHQQMLRTLSKGRSIVELGAREILQPSLHRLPLAQFLMVP